VQELAVDAGRSPHAPAAQRHRPLGDRVEHRLNVARRSGHHVQDFADRGVLFQCLGKALLELHVGRAVDLLRFPGDS
jgi:hypothetical protein